MKGIVFSSEPFFGSRIRLLILTAPGVTYPAEALGSHFYGNGKWQSVKEAFPDFSKDIVSPQLLREPGFRFTSVGVSWEQFLDETYDHVDFVLFYNAETRKFHEVSKGNLLHQNPLFYAYSFMEIEQNPPLTETKRSDTMAQDKLKTTIDNIHGLISTGWTVAAISRGSNVNQITLANIRDEKASRISDKVYQRIADFKALVDAGKVQPPTRGRKGAGKAVKSPAQSVPASTKAKPGPAKAAKPAAKTMQSGGIINTNYVPVNITELQGVIDRLIANFSGAIAELESLKKQIKM